MKPVLSTLFFKAGAKGKVWGALVPAPKACYNKTTGGSLSAGRLRDEML